MTWLRIDDAFAQHPKVIQAGSRAAWLDVAGMCYASRYLTDGFVPAGMIHKLTDEPNPDELAQALVDAGLWEVRPGGYLIHDYLEYNPSAAQVRENRRRDAARKIPPGFRPDSKRIPASPSPEREIEREKGEELELDEPTTRLAAAFYGAMHRSPSAHELAQLSQIDATPDELSEAVGIAVQYQATNVLAYAAKVLADRAAGAAATKAAAKSRPAPAASRPRPAPDPDPLANLWKTTLDELKLQMTRNTYATWFANSAAVSRSDHTLVVRVENDCAKQWIQERLLTLVERTLSGIAEEDLHVRITTKGETECPNN